MLSSTKSTEDSPVPNTPTARAKIKSIAIQLREKNIAWEHLFVTAQSLKEILAKEGDILLSNPKKEGANNIAIVGEAALSLHFIFQHSNPIISKEKEHYTNVLPEPIKHSTYPFLEYAVSLGNEEATLKKYCYLALGLISSTPEDLKLGKERIQEIAENGEHSQTKQAQALLACLTSTPLDSKKFFVAAGLEEIFDLDRKILNTHANLVAHQKNIILNAIKEKYSSKISTPTKENINDLKTFFDQRLKDIQENIESIGALVGPEKTSYIKDCNDPVGLSLKKMQVELILIKQIVALLKSAPNRSALFSGRLREQILFAATACYQDLNALRSCDENRMGTECERILELLSRKMAGFPEVQQAVLSAKEAFDDPVVRRLSRSKSASSGTPPSSNLTILPI